ncbi:serine/threonine protein kinase, partial [Streptomyces sp. NPDC001935]
MSEQPVSERACGRPGCEGSYEDVGGGELYCDTCGLAPAEPAPGSSRSGSAPASGAGEPPASGRTCGRPGCEGSYEDVGGGELYCDTCGLAPAEPA